MLYPEEIERVDQDTVIKKKDRSRVIVGPESMSKSKNAIDPETMINQYGADAVRWFILSDSPRKKTYNGLMQGLYLLINFYKKYGI